MTSHDDSMPGGGEGDRVPSMFSSFSNLFKGGAGKEERRYTVTKASSGGDGGTYASKSGPAAAAKKAASKRFKSGTTKIRLTIRQLGSKREFTYDAQRVKLPQPVIRKIGNTTVKSEYKTEVKAVKKSA